MQRFIINISEDDIDKILAPMIHELEYEHFPIVIGKLIAGETISYK